MRRLRQPIKTLLILVCLSAVFFLMAQLFSPKSYSKEVYYSTTATGTSISAINQSSSTQVKVLFTGDMMFDRHIRKMATRNSEDFLFSCIDPLFFRHDFVVGNLEGPITTKRSTSIDTKVGSPENYYFTFPTSTAKLLFNHNIRLVSIGNNHIYNQGRDGVLQTRRFLSEANVGYFGGQVGDESIYRMTEHGIPFSFISYNQFGGEKEEIVAGHIIDEKAQGRVVIVYAHWGEEYQDVVESVRVKAKLFAESGADFIVGSHPHVIQSHEVIKHTPVYYSLGNFIFDQYFQPEVMEGLVLSVTFSQNKTIDIKEHLVRMNKDGRTCLVENDASAKF